MKRTLGEWEKLWREKWDINDYADLDQVFVGTKAYKDVVCEVEINILTQEGRIETVAISLFADLGEDTYTVLASYEYSMLELGRVELEQDVIAPLNLWPDEEEETPPGRGEMSQAVTTGNETTTRFLTMRFPWLLRTC